MRQDIKERWVERLRSGQYEQGAVHLRATFEEVTRYCCLGVLCEVAVEDGAIPPASKSGYYWFYSGNSTGLPKEVSQWAGIDPLQNFGPSVTIDGRTTSLASFNDMDTPFEVIATAIEEQL